MAMLYRKTRRASHTCRYEKELTMSSGDRSMGFGRVGVPGARRNVLIVSIRRVCKACGGTNFFWLTLSCRCYHT